LVEGVKRDYRPVAALDRSNIAATAAISQLQQQHSAATAAAEPIAVAACQSAKVDDRSAAIER